MSDNSVQLIIETILKSSSPLYVVEYGSGNSTLYFLENLIKNKKSCDFISVEHSSQWYEVVIQEIENAFKDQIKDVSTYWTHWPFYKYARYMLAKNQSELPIPRRFLKLSYAKRLMLTSSPKFISKMFFGNTSYHFTNADYTCSIANTIRLSYRLRWCAFKDQYGESPTKRDGIDAGIEMLINTAKRSQDDISAIFIVDGGPRADICSKLFNLEENYPNIRLNIFLLEAHRLIYNDTLKRRPSGVFVKGSNRNLNGGQVYKKFKNVPTNTLLYGKPKPDLSFLCDKELWHYSN